MSRVEPIASAPRRPRPPPRPAVVVGVWEITRRVMGIRFGGEAMAGFTPPRPSGHIKLFFEKDPGAWTPMSDGPRPPSRTFTPRHFDAARGELDVEFVLHGEGLASKWATTAKPGDPVWISGPGGGFEVDQSLRHVVVLADESAMPAAGMILEALPPTCAGTVYCEIESRQEERPISPVASVEPQWLHRGARRPSAVLEEAVAAIDAHPDSFWWVACEAMAMRRIRRHLMERGVARTRLITRGYWLAGESNHPDHDYGED